jgi:hypothetical protein
MNTLLDWLYNGIAILFVVEVCLLFVLFFLCLLVMSSSCTVLPDVVSFLPSRSMDLFAHLDQLTIHRHDFKFGPSHVHSHSHTHSHISHQHVHSDFTHIYMHELERYEHPEEIEARKYASIHLTTQLTATLYNIDKYVSQLQVDVQCCVSIYKKWVHLYYEAVKYLRPDIHK